MNAAYEDIRAATPVSDLTLSMQSAIDEIDGAIAEAIDFKNEPEDHSKELDDESNAADDGFDNDDPAIIVGSKIEVYWPARG